jgi:hypothetical protein
MGDKKLKNSRGSVWIWIWAAEADKLAEVEGDGGVEGGLPCSSLYSSFCFRVILLVILPVTSAHDTH